MSIIDKVVAAVTPPESDQARADARAKAQSMAQPGSWLAQVLDHHRGIEAAFDAVASASDTAARSKAQKHLQVLLTGHSVAEEAVLYPTMAGEHQPGHAELAYQEQSAAKMELGMLETLDPMSQDYQDKFEHIRGAVLHHIYSEEGTWFPELMDTASPADHQRMTARYTEEYKRYMGNDA